MPNPTESDGILRQSTRHRLRAGVVAFAATAILLLCGLQAYVLLEQREDALASGEKAARAEVLAAVAELRGSLAAIDATLMQISTHASHLGGPHGTAGTWWAFLDTARQAANEVSAVLVVDEVGIVRHATDPRLVGTSYGDRLVFETLRDGGRETVAFDMPTTAADGMTAFGMGRRLSPSFDEFTGIVVAIFPSSIFERIAQHAYKQTESLRIQHAKGFVLVHEPPEGVLPGASATEYPAFKRFRAGQTEGTIRGAVGRDAGRIISFVVVTQPTLVVATSLSEDAVLEDWRRDVRFDSAVVTGFAVALLVAAFFIVRRLQEQEAVEQALGRQDHELRLAQSVAGVGSLTLDARTGTMLFSPEFARIVGWPTERNDGPFSKLIDLVVPAERERVDEAVRNCARVGGPLELDMRTTLAKGEERILRLRGLGDGNGTAVVVLQDITDMLENEVRLRENQKLEAMGQLTGGVAHDFNNLLTVILGNSEQLAADLKDQPALRSMAEMTLKAAERGAELTRRLLAFARRQTLAPRETNANALVVGMDELMRRTLGEHIEIEVVAAPDLWLTLVDANQLETALLNLAINARDAMADGGKLTIRTSNVHLDHEYAAMHEGVRAQDYVAISVVDTGCGMTPEVRARAFEPFFTTKEVGKGSGLGLSMVFGFVKQSGGHVSIYSEPGHGTEIRLYLPRSDEKAPSAAPQASAISPGGIETILMVEDEPMVRESARAMLESLGYRVLIAENGPRALVALASPGPIDLLLTDMMMPGGMTGRALADEAARLRSGIKVLFMSGYSAETISGFPGMGAASFLQKPFRRDALARKVRQALAGTPYTPNLSS